MLMLYISYVIRYTDCTAGGNVETLNASRKLDISIVPVANTEVLIADSLYIVKHFNNSY